MPIILKPSGSLPGALREDGPFAGRGFGPPGLRVPWSLGKGGEKSFQARELPVPGMVAIGDLWMKADLIPGERAPLVPWARSLGKAAPSLTGRQ